MTDADRMNGADLIALERARQITEEHWTAKDDDDHTRGALAIAAACYAANGTDAEVLVHGYDAWPFAGCFDKRRAHPRIRQLTIAGALIAAEIDRVQRAAHVG